ncbi:hypothetical protein RRG08_045800 [Elysia crispata]|uniref:RCC1-like domain-containing protein n=1 Tax=Elysia crispata TaxID=231223 RepID=A0AAE0YYB2_9GAST|nr:hypothetical protein RRG08_045800 [Elysia crispata]
MTTIDERAVWAVWAWGANNCGQLGCGHPEDLLAPTVLKMSDTMSESAHTVWPGLLTGGGAFSVMLTDSGRVLTSGKNDCGQLGQEPQKCEDGNHYKDTLFFSPCLLSDTITVTQVAAGWNFVLALTGTGSIISWGSNSFGQLGRVLSGGMKMDPTPASLLLNIQPLLVPTPGVSKFVDVAAGLRHGLAISECGHVYSWGSGRKGQLGVAIPQGKSLLDSPVPVSLSLAVGDKPIQVVAGMNFSGVLTERGIIFLWGCNKFGQCGVDPATEFMLKLPSQLKLPEEMSRTDNGQKHLKVVSVAAGWTHMIFKTDNKQLYSWGRADLGQLGRSTDLVPQHMPGHIAIEEKITSHCCSSEHNLALTDKGQVYSWGWNEHGICGTGDEDNVFLPRLISSLLDKTVMGVGCGAGHCFCWTMRPA